MFLIDFSKNKNNLFEKIEDTTVIIFRKKEANGKNIQFKFYRCSYHKMIIS